MENDTSKLDAALDLLRRLPPNKTEENLLRIIELVPEHANALLATVDVPCKVRVCKKTCREYLTCDYNRDGDSYRSPWSNEYEPLVAEEEGAAGLKPSAKLRKLEIVANEAFDTYRTLYYEGGVSSVYFWDVDEHNFAAAVLIKKETESDGLRYGCWDSIHVVEVTNSVGQRQASYKLTTTIQLEMDSAVAKLDSFGLCGSITRQTEQACNVAVEEDHIANMGRLIEDMELRMRSTLQEIYFGKTHDVVNEIRTALPPGYLPHQADLQREMAGKLATRSEA